MAADRIAASLQQLNFADAPVWEAAQQRLLERLLGSRAATKAPSSDAASVGQAGMCTRLAAAVAAAAAGVGGVAGAPALEEEGLPYEDPQPKVNKASAPCRCHALVCSA